MNNSFREFLWVSCCYKALTSFLTALLLNQGDTTLMSPKNLMSRDGMDKSMRTTTISNISLTVITMDGGRDGSNDTASGVDCPVTASSCNFSHISFFR